MVVPPNTQNAHVGLPMVVGYQHIRNHHVSTRMTFVVFRRPEDPKPTRIVARSVGSPWHVKGVAEVSRWSRLPIAKDGETVLAGGFKYFLFSPLLRDDFQFDQYFSNGLKPPTRWCSTVVSTRNNLQLLPQVAKIQPSLDAIANVFNSGWQQT